MATEASTTRPKAVVFDLGKVLLDFDYGIALRRLLPRMRISPRQVKELVSRPTLLLDYEAGLFGTAEFFEKVRALTGYTGGLGEFGAVFGDIFSEIGAMVELQAELRRRQVATYILSNTNELAIAAIRRRFPFFAGFDGYVFSYEHRSMKPAPRLYQITEEMTGLRGPDLFYFDDRPENVQAARERGWQAVVHVTPEASRAALAATGCLDGSCRIP